MVINENEYNTVNKKTTPKGFLLSGCLIKCRYRLR